jgi:predicted Zn-dependent peptidase
MIRHCVAIFLMLLGLAVQAQDSVTLPDATRLELDNGLVLLLNEKHDVPLVGVTAIIKGGAAADPDGKDGMASLFAALMQKGAGERSAAEIAEAIDSAGGNLAASAELEYIEVSGDFMARDTDLLIELLADMLQRPALDREELGKLRDRRINLIRSAKDSDPGQLMPLYFSAFLFGDHPYGNATFGGEESLRDVSHDDVVNYYADQVGADRTIIALSGDFIADVMAEKLTAAFGEWRPAGAELATIEAPARPGEKRVLLIDKPGATQTHFWFGNVGVARDYAGRADLDIANTLFGGRFTSMLNAALRVESGLTYGARSNLERLSQPGYIAVASYTRTDATVEAIDMARGVLGRLRDNGLDETMIESAQNYIMGLYPLRLETSAQLAEVFATLEAGGQEFTYINDYGANIAAASLESVAAVVDAVYPADDELVFVFVGDAEQIREAISQYGPVTEMSITEPRFFPLAAP